jgi:transposase InsO family protein
MDQKTEFALRAVRGIEPFQQLCEEFGISRKTGYKWKERFLQQGLDGLHDQSRKPKTSPGELGEDVVCRIVSLKQAHPSWGARKLREVMLRCPEGLDVPSESSFKRVLEKAGLVHKRRRRIQSETGRLQSRVKSERPNQVWTIDFKGWWRTRDRGRFEPLTIRDDFSRFILCARSLENTRTEAVKEQMEKLFCERGLPEIIRSDNGAPFAAPNSPFGLTRLSAWWLALGIDLDRIRPGKPQENGGHERMHRDMLELQRSAQATLAEQQAALDVWRRTFNEERPHEALEMKLPAEVYEQSARTYDPTAMELSYPAGVLVRRIDCSGQLKIRNVRICISVALAGYDVGLQSLDDARYAVWFGRLCIGEVNLQLQSFQAARE